MESDTYSGRGAHGIVHAKHDSRHGAVRVIEVDLGVGYQLKRRKGRGALDDEHFVLRNQMTPLAQHRSSVDVIIDHEPKLSASLDGHGEDVDARVGQHAANAGQRAGVVRQPQCELDPNHYPSTRMTTRRFWRGLPSTCCPPLASSCRS